MFDQFLLNLSVVLSHTLVYETNILYPKEYCSKLVNGGDPPAMPAGESTDQIMQAWLKNLPAILSTTNQGLKSTAEAQYGADAAVSPQYAQLQTDLYGTYGPKLNQIGNDIAGQNMLAQASNENATLQGPGKDLINNALSLEKQIDPEFFQQRTNLNNKITDLTNSYDLSGNLPGGVRAELERSVNRDNNSRGLNGSSNTSVVQNAMKFGQAGQAMQAQNQAGLANAINIGAGYLPGSRAGIDPLQVGVGRSSGGNTGDQKFVGNQANSGANANQVASNSFNQIGALQQQRNDIESKRRDSLDRVTEVMGSLPSD